MLRELRLTIADMKRTVLQRDDASGAVGTT
jgi:hypothetical protein